MARAIEKRGTQFGIYLKKHIFQEHMIRLSVNMHHKHIDEAFPIRLVHGISGTPWHHTPIVDSKKKVKLIYHENEHFTVRSGKYKGINIQWMEYLETPTQRGYIGWN